MKSWAGVARGGGSVLVVLLFVGYLFFQKNAVSEVLSGFDLGCLSRIVILYVCFYVLGVLVLLSMLGLKPVAWSRVVYAGAINTWSSFVGLIFPIRIAGHGLKVVLLSTSFDVDMYSSIRIVGKYAFFYALLCLLGLVCVIVAARFGFDLNFALLVGGGVSLMFLPWVSWGVLVYTVLQLLVSAWITWFLLLAVGYELSLSVCVVMCLVGSLSLLISITPGGLGVKEFVYSWVGGLYDVGSSEIVAALLVDRLIQFSLLFFLSVLFFFVVPSLLQSVVSMRFSKNS